MHERLHPSSNTSSLRTFGENEIFGCRCEIIWLTWKRQLFPLVVFSSTFSWQEMNSFCQLIACASWAINVHAIMAWCTQELTKRQRSNFGEQNAVHARDFHGKRVLSYECNAVDLIKSNRNAAASHLVANEFNKKIQLSSRILVVMAWFSLPVDFIHYAFRMHLFYNYLHKGNAIKAKSMPSEIFNSAIKKLKPVTDVRQFPISGYDANARLIEEEDSACPTLLEHDFNKFHHTIPGLRRSGVDANAIRQVGKENKSRIFFWKLLEKFSD